MPRAYAVAVGDVDRDGTLDLVTAHRGVWTSLVVLAGQGGGRFRIARRYHVDWATDVALGDVNGDARLDVVLAMIDGDIGVALGNGDGSFGRASRYEGGVDAFGVTLADVNADGRLDMAVGDYIAGGVWLFAGVGDGTFGVGSGYPMGEYENGSNVDAVHVADFDRDGNVDIATGGVSAPSVRRGAGDGTFLARRDVFGCCFRTVAGAVADFNRDGWPDLAFSGDCDEIEFPGCRVRSAYVFLNWTGEGASPCVVPRLRGLPLRLARRELRRSGCRPDDIRGRHSRAIRKRRVVAQSPGYGRVLPSRSPIDLVVSRGRRR